MIDRQRRVSELCVVTDRLPMRAGVRARGYDKIMTRLQSAIQRLSGGGQNTKELDTSVDSEQVDGVVEEVRTADDPRLPELGDEEDIEMLSDGADLLRVRCGTVEYQTTLDGLIGRTRQVDQIREVLVDLDGLGIEVGDEIVVDALPIGTDEDPTTADLYLSTDESALARIRQDSPESVGELSVRDDQLDERMDLVPFFSRRQRIEIGIERLTYRLMMLIRGRSDR